jgi:ATP-dependent protease ClpP protease subunit
MKQIDNYCVLNSASKSFDDLAQDIERDYFMSAAEAVAYGLADQVIANRASIVA